MFYWYVDRRMEDGSIRRFSDEQWKHSFSAYFRRHREEVVQFGVIIADFKLELDNGDIIRWHKYARKMNGRKVIGVKVEKRSVDYKYSGDNLPELRIHCLQSTKFGVVFRYGFTLDPKDREPVSFDDRLGQFV